MSWNKMTPQQKVAWLTKQQAEITRAKAVIERFEKLTTKWLKTAQAQASKKRA